LEIPAAKAKLMENRPVEPRSQPAPKPAAQAMAAEVRTAEISASASEVKPETAYQSVNPAGERVSGVETPLATPENPPESTDETGPNVL